MWTVKLILSIRLYLPNLRLLIFRYFCGCTLYEGLVISFSNFDIFSEQNRDICIIDWDGAVHSFDMIKKTSMQIDEFSKVTI